MRMANPLSASPTRPRIPWRLPIRHSSVDFSAMVASHGALLLGCRNLSSAAAWKERGGYQANIFNTIHNIAVGRTTQVRVWATGRGGLKGCGGILGQYI